MGGGVQGVNASGQQDMFIGGVRPSTGQPGKHFVDTYYVPALGRRCNHIMLSSLFAVYLLCAGLYLGHLI